MNQKMIQQNHHRLQYPEQEEYQQSGGNNINGSVSWYIYFSEWRVHYFHPQNIRTHLRCENIGVHVGMIWYDLKIRDGSFLMLIYVVSSNVAHWFWLGSFGAQTGWIPSAMRWSWWQRNCMKWWIAKRVAVWIVPIVISARWNACIFIVSWKIKVVGSMKPAPLSLGWTKIGKHLRVWWRGWWYPRFQMKHGV